MKNEAENHEDKLEELIGSVVERYGLDRSSIDQHSEETVQKATQMMQTYLGEDPDTLDALEFLCLAKGGEVTLYKVLGKLAAGTRDKKFATGVRSILR